MEVSSFWENEENAEDSGAEKQRLKGLTQMEWIQRGFKGGLVELLSTREMQLGKVPEWCQHIVDSNLYRIKMNEEQCTDYSVQQFELQVRSTQQVQIWEEEKLAQ